MSAHHTGKNFRKQVDANEILCYALQGQAQACPNVKQKKKINRLTRARAAGTLAPARVSDLT
jgi:hypothetical protein